MNSQSQTLFCWVGDQQPRISLFWQPATQNLIVLTTGNSKWFGLANSDPESHCFDDRQLRISLFWQLATQNLIILTAGNPGSYHFDNRQLRILLFWQPATQNDLVWRLATQNHLVWWPPNLSSTCHLTNQKIMLKTQQ